MAYPVDERAALSWFTRPRRLPEIQAARHWLDRARKDVLDHDGQPLVTWQWGEGPTVLLVHGWEGAAAQFHALLPGLLDTGYRVIAPDMPAHGASAGERSNFFAFADALRAVVDRAEAVHGGIDTVIAHSMGSPAALHAFAGGLHVARSVHVAGPVSLARVVERVGRMLGLAGPARQRVADRLARKVGRPLAAADLDRVMPGLRHPALLLHDPADEVVPYGESEILAKAWPGARLLPLPAAGHAEILADPRLLRLLSDFLREPATAAA